MASTPSPICCPIFPSPISVKVQWLWRSPDLPLPWLLLHNPITNIWQSDLVPSFNNEFGSPIGAAVEMKASCGGGVSRILYPRNIPSMEVGASFARPGSGDLGLPQYHTRQPNGPCSHRRRNSPVLRMLRRWMSRQCHCMMSHCVWPHRKRHT